MRLARLIAVLLAATLLAGCGGGDDPTTKSPQRLPDVTLEHLQGGGAVDLGSLRGPLVVNLWASWCVPCRTELPLYAAFARAYDGKVQVLGVDFQDQRTDKALELLDDTGVTFPNVRDFDGVFRAIGLPKLLLVDADGTVVYDEYVKITSLEHLEGLVADHLGVSR